MLASTVALSHAIIIKDFNHIAKVLKYPAPSYLSTARAASQLHTLAIPKPLQPIPAVYNTFAKPIIAAPVSNVFVKSHSITGESFNPNPSYSFSYGVKDPSTGDSKMQEESLVNGIVRGSYSLAEPDGTIRRVTYTADDINGFQARVEKIGTPVFPKTPAAVIPAVTKIPVPSVPVVKTVPAYQATPIYHKGLISSVLVGGLHG